MSRSGPQSAAGIESALANVLDGAEPVPPQQDGHVARGQAGEPRLAVFRGHRRDQVGVRGAGLVAQRGGQRGGQLIGEDDRLLIDDQVGGPGGGCGQGGLAGLAGLIPWGRASGGRRRMA